MPAVDCFAVAWQPAGAAIAVAMASHNYRRTSSSTAVAFLFPVFAVISTALLAAEAATINDDAAALLAFKVALVRAERLSSWSNASACCESWRGVTCSSRNGGSSTEQGRRVVQLRLPGLALSGTIAAGTLGKLDALEVLSLHNNFLQGSFPEDMVNCTSLKQIVITNNNFSGSLPSDAMVAAWPLLQTLDTASNSFSGTIPAAIAGLTKLRHLLLQQNRLSGPIPPQLDAIAASLKSFSVANNSLQGSIPSSLQRFGEASFAGNADLCGPPLQAPCPSATPPLSLPPSSTPVMPPLPPPSSSPSSSGLSSGVIAAIAVGCAAAALLVTCLLLLYRQRRRSPPPAKKEDLFAEGREEFHRRMMRRNSSRLAAPAAPPTGRARIAENKAKQSFDMNDLLRASAEVIGKGSLGTVYKVEMDSGLLLCVKRLRRRSGPAAAFEPPAEGAAPPMVGAVESEEIAFCRRILENLCSLSHPNLVPLRAHFIDQNEKLLISDYAPHHSLSALLHGSKGRKAAAPEWRRRLAVAAAASKGLVFLHSRKVVHGSIKSTNLLIGGEGDAMWTDYGLLPVAAAAAPPNGYTPPEAMADTIKINYKGDVYAFGVLLLEILTGKQPAAVLHRGGSVVTLPQWVLSLANQEDALDRQMVKNRNEQELEEMLCLLSISMACVSLAPDRRPYMVEVVKQIGDLRDQAAVAAAIL